MPNSTSSSSRKAMFCGVDLGSTNMKVVLVSEEGFVVSRRCQKTPRADDLSIDADEIMRSVENLIVAACGDDFRIRAIAVAGIGEDGVLLDDDLEPLHRVLTWFDPRRVALFDDIHASLTAMNGAGTPLDPSRTLVGWAWSMGQPGASRARSWVALTDYLAVRWTEKPFMSDTLAARTTAWDVNGEYWHNANVQATLGQLDRLPTVLPSGAVVGPLRSPTLQAAGVLTPEAFVVAGGHDHPIGGWGVRQHDGTAVLDSMGTAEVVVGHTDVRSLPAAPMLDTAAGICQPGMTLISVTELGRNIEWASQDEDVARWIRRIAAGEQQPHEALDDALFEPGAPGGGQPSYTPLGRAASAHTKASGVLGALARLGAEHVRNVAEQVPGKANVYAAGGWARSPGWIAIKERYLDAPIRIIPEKEVTAVGAAMLAAQSCKARPNPSACLTIEPLDSSRRHLLT